MARDPRFEDLSLEELEGRPDCAVIRLKRCPDRDRLPDLRWRLHDLLTEGRRVIVVDLARTPQIGSATLATLLGAHRVCRARRGSVVLRDPGEPTTELLRRTGLRRVLPVAHRRAPDPDRGPRAACPIV